MKTAGPLEITWPNGNSQTVRNLALNQYNTIDEDSGSSDKVAAFWQKTREKLANEPMEPEVEQVREPLPYRKYRVTLRGLNGVRFRA